MSNETQTTDINYIEVGNFRLCAQPSYVLIVTDTRIPISFLILFDGNFQSTY